MLDPISMKNLSQIRYQELLQEAAAERRYRPSEGNGPHWLQNVGNLLIAAGQKLQAQAPATPALNAK
jgi:hypothetical protein